MLDGGRANLERIGLLRRAPDPGFARLARLARRLVAAPTALVGVALPEEDRLVFRAAAGLPEPWAARDAMPLSQAWCRIVVETGRPLAVRDGREAGGLIADGLGVAYLGAPLPGPDGAPIGSVCAMDLRPRDWSDEDVALMEDVAAAVGQQVALLAALHDRDLAIERAWKARLAKSRMLASMSHEIRTPLFGVLGVVQILQDVVVGPEKKRMCETIRASGEALLAVVDDVLDLSKIEIGGLELAEDVFGPLAVAEAADALLAPLAARKGLSFLVEAWDAAACDRVGDAQRVQQIVNHLLTNAIGSTERGYVRLTLTGGPGEPLRVEVEDTGAGTPLDEPEPDAEPSGPRRMGGRGLGMMIVRGLIAQMDGRIAVEAERGVGTRVRVDLPFPARPVDPALRALRTGGAPPSLAGLRALVVCGDPDGRFVIETMLGRLGVGATIVADGRAALDAWEPQGADVALIDLGLPDIDGVDLLAALAARAAERQAAPPPAVALVTSASDAPPAAGFAGALAKPMHLAELIREIDRVVGREAHAA